MSLAAAILAPGGLLSRVLPETFEHRPEQLRMAEAAGRTLARGGVLLVEAGTGTGKTLAYLAAALDADRRVVVSTGTRTLQDQLLKSDIPLLERALGREIGALCLKGLGNYVCLRRLDALARCPDLLLAHEAELLARVERWASTSETGDRAELEDLPEDLPLWRDLCSDPETRLGPRCPFHEACFVTRARRAAAEARIVVVNHHLLFADLALRDEGAGVLPDYDALVLDEAHAVDSVATAFFGLRVSARRLGLLGTEAGRELAAAAREGRVERGAGRARLEELATSSAAFFRAVRPRAGEGEGRAELVAEELGGEVEAAYWRLDAGLEALACHLEGVPAGGEPLSACARRAERIRADLSAILGQDRRTSVRWTEATGGGAVGASPVDAADIVRERLFYQVEAVVLTSATLTADGSFAYVRERLGIDFDADELVLPSPFDYRRQAALLLPRDATDPRREGHAEAVADLLVEACDLVKGGALALFTSTRVMGRVAELVRPRAGRTVRVQGERPRHALLAELREGAEPLLLLATASFWQGVDVPGEGLELVAIARLPFASPGDPVVSARLRALEADGRSPFEEYQVPQAALSLKQGFGRLVRSRRDRGIVAILDGRIRSMGYGRVLLRSLPDCTVVEDIEEARRWWLQGGSEPRQGSGGQS